MADILMPQLGETVAEGTVAKWLKKVGESVEKGEALFEVSTDKVDTEIPAPASGVLHEIRVSEGQTVDVGTVLAVIAAPGEPITSAPSPVAATPRGPEHSKESSPPREARESGEGERSRLSPLVKRLLEENDLRVDEVTGSGPGGRITKDDVAAAAAARDSSGGTGEVSDSLVVSPVVRRLLSERGLRQHEVTGPGPHGRLTRRDVEAARTAHSGDEVIAFTKIRRLTAEHMVRSKATSAHTLMVREIDYEAVETVRRREGPRFKADEGFSLTYLPFISVATLRVLREFPHLNASVGDNELIVHHDLNLGVAVDLDSEGLVVPVLRRADSLGVRAMARAVRDVATRARSKSLGVDDMSQGTFTITNPGPYGTLLTGAVINQPQVAILATDGVKRKPVVVTSEHGDEAIAIHSVGLVALTFDHRAVDGAYCARFLARVADVLEGDWTHALDA